MNSESNAFQAELAEYKAGENEYREELDAEVHKREVLEADFIKINA